MALMIFMSIHNATHTNVKILVVPEDSSLQINGQAQKPGNFNLKKDIYKISATRQFFDKAEETIDISKAKDGDVIYILPVPNSAEAKKWLAENPGVQQQREAAGGEEFGQQQEVILSEYPIISSLPIENESFRIDYSISQYNEPEFTVNLFGTIRGAADYERYKQKLQSSKAIAIEYLEKNGVDIKKVKITFVPNI